jgi:hypothetical protein
MQRSLFDQSNLLKIEFQKKLREFCFAEAFELLQQMGRSFELPLNFEDKLRALDTLCRQTAPLANSKAAALAAYYLELAECDFRKPLETEWPHIRLGFFQAIGLRLDPEFTAYILPGFHVAEIFLETGKFDRAVDAVLQHIKECGEDALLRQIQSCALLKKGDVGAARRCLSMALFNDPGLCLERFPMDKDIAIEWRELREKTTTQLALNELPFVLWKKELLPIRGNSDKFERFIGAEIEKKKNNKGTLPAPKVHFIRLLYLAELCRQQTISLDNLVEYRREMETIDPDKFAEYMNVIRQLEKNKR